MSGRDDKTGAPGPGAAGNAMLPQISSGTESGANGRTLMQSIRQWLRFNRRPRNGEHLRDAIGELIEDESGEAAFIQDDERVLLRNILQLHDTTVEDVLVPRADIVAVPGDISQSELVKLFSGSGHSRLPVYRDGLDDIVGMVHIKDVVSVMGSRRKFRLSAIMRDVLYVVPWTPVLDLLLQMRTRRQHLAIVIDEFGGTDGLVSIEDLVEEIVGEIKDEHDEEEEPGLEVQKDGTIAADARVPVSDLEARFGPVLTEEEREDIQSLGGLVFMLAGRVPSRGELIPHSSGIEFEVVEADPRKIKRLRLRSLPAGS